MTRSLCFERERNKSTIICDQKERNLKLSNKLKCQRYDVGLNRKKVNVKLPTLNFTSVSQKNVGLTQLQLKRTGSKPLLDKLFCFVCRCHFLSFSSFSHCYYEFPTCFKRLDETSADSNQSSCHFNRNCMVIAQTYSVEC